MCREMASAPFLVMKVYRVHAIAELIDLCGPDDPDRAKIENEASLRAQFGVNMVQNAVYPAKNRKEVDQLTRDFFNNTAPHQLLHQYLPEKSLVIIKPNAAKEYGNVIRAQLIGEGFRILQQKVFNLNALIYQQLIYDAPLDHKTQIAEYMASGMVIALIVEKVNCIYPFYTILRIRYESQCCLFLLC